MVPFAAMPRRAFLRSAVAAGGTAALAACLDRESPSVPTGPTDLSMLPRRQHAWQTALPRDGHGNVVQPRHRVMLSMALRESGPPTDSHRDTVERSLRGLERAYARAGDGLILTIGYSPAYFDRFESNGPRGVTLPAPEPLSPFEDPDLESPDVIVDLGSNYASVVLAAEAALRGDRTSLNGVEQPAAPLTDVLEIVDRRTGFIGEGLPAANDDVVGVPEGAVPDDAPLFMGFKSGFRKNQASEDRVTIQSGPFAGGTSQHVSTLTMNLDQWYQQDSRWQRVAKMFCPHHAEADLVEGPGDNLGEGTAIGECRETDTAARELGVVGHSQKTARVREKDEPLLLRRDFDSTDNDRVGLHFVAHQRAIEDFVATREAMNGTDVASNSAVGERNNNGILQYIRTERRSNFLLPPRSLRALPPATPEVDDAPA